MSPPTVSLPIFPAVVSIAAGGVPLLSAANWPTALRIALTSDDLWVLFACANWRAGLIAISVMARRTARIPITTRSSMSVNPF